MNIPRFEYSVRRNRGERTKTEPVDHGPDNKRFERREGIKLGSVLLLCLLFAVGFVCAALSMWFENVEDS